MEEIILSYNLVFPILTINDGVDDDDSIIDGRDSPSSLTSFLQHYGTEEKVFAYRYVYAGCRRRSGRSASEFEIFWFFFTAQSLEFRFTTNGSDSASVTADKNKEMPFRDTQIEREKERKKERKINVFYWPMTQLV